MAIVNATPDSFYAPSRTESDEAVRHRVRRALREGADILDIGGYSTRPGAADVPLDEELRRVTMAVVAARGESEEVWLSVDTFRSEVAESVLKRWNRVIINDITAGERDGRMVDVVAHYGAPMVAMHTRGTPQTMQGLTDYTDVVAEVCDYLSQRAEWLLSRGVKEVIVDPGFGFAKSIEQNYRLVEGLDKVADLGYEVLVGISRKSFIYRTLGCEPESEATLKATSALHLESLSRGASILRVHDVAAARKVIDLYEQNNVK